MPARKFETAAFAVTVLKSAALVFCRNLRLSISCPLLRSPERSPNEAFRVLFGVVIIYGDDLAVLALYAAGIAQIPTPAVLSQNDFVAPTAPVITADPGYQTEWLH